VRFNDQFIEELKSRLRPSDVIGRTVKLKRQGREFVGLSPFSKEKSPSFFVNDDKGFFHDFSSGKHGDIISFLQETERLSFVEAIERLAGEAGMALPEPDAQSAQQEKVRSSLTDWLDLASKWFEAELRRPPGADARAYLERRGLPASEWERFRIGLAPASRTGLKDYLVAKGAMPGELVEAGLLIAPEDGGAPYDRFRDRVIFPITDGRGRIVSFGGRALDPNAKAKYLNGPDTVLFDKGRTLYGLFEARKILHSAPAAEQGDLVVVEGYMDVIACHRAGIAAAAPMGTALTEGQMELLWRLHPEPTLCFDGDAAGRRAAGRAIDRALPVLRPGRSFKFALVTGGKDPDDVLREKGAAALKEMLSQTVPLVEALFVRERDLEPLDTPERKAGLKGRLRTLAASIADKDLAQAYRDDLLARLDALFAASRPAWKPQGGGDGRGRGSGRFARPDIPQPPSAEGMAAARRLASSIEGLPAALAKAALDDPHRIDDHLEALERHGFGDPTLDKLAAEVVRVRITADSLDSEALQRHLRGCGYDSLLNDIDRAAAKSGAPFLKPDVTLAAARSQWSYAFEVQGRVAALEEAIASAKSNLAGGVDMATLRRLKSERDGLKRALRSGDLWTDSGAATDTP
jgi:DNA primase